MVKPSSLSFALHAIQCILFYYWTLNTKHCRISRRRKNREIREQNWSHCGDGRCWFQSYRSPALIFLWLSQFSRSSMPFYLSLLIFSFISVVCWVSFKSRKLPTAISVVQSIRMVGVSNSERWAWFSICICWMLDYVIYKNTRQFEIQQTRYIFDMAFRMHAYKTGSILSAAFHSFLVLLLPFAFRSG